MIRLFTAVELPLGVRQQLCFMQGGIPGARWTSEGNHLTLCFIGEVDEGTAEDIDGVLSDLRAPAFDLEPAGVGQFDRNGVTRILWAGVRPSPGLEHLQEKIHTALQRTRLPVEQRRFTPHITLARIKGGGDQPRIFHWLGQHNLFAAPAFHVDSFALFESLSTGDGPVYRPMRRYRLKD